MKALLQRVTSASVTVNGEVISSIGKGLCVLVGIHRDDSEQQMEHIVRKVINYRVFDDPETGRRWDKSAKDLDLEILCVSQFTLYHVVKGNKPDFHLSMQAEKSKAFYERFLERLRSSHQRPDAIKDGEFGAMMEVNIVNDGPVTVEIESQPDTKPRSKEKPPEEGCP